jgi:hypothetical protein
MPKVGPQNDPHMSSPWPKRIIILLIIGAALYFVAPKIIEIYNDNLHDTNERAENS